VSTTIWCKQMAVLSSEAACDGCGLSNVHEEEFGFHCAIFTQRLIL
jgi:hypothetical protein